MTIQDALKTEKPVRRPSWRRDSCVVYNEPGRLVKTLTFHSGIFVRELYDLDAESILADDWEIAVVSTENG